MENIQNIYEKILNTYNDILYNKKYNISFKQKQNFTICQIDYYDAKYNFPIYSKTDLSISFNINTIRLINYFISDRDNVYDINKKLQLIDDGKLVKLSKELNKLLLQEFMKTNFYDDFIKDVSMVMYNYLENNIFTYKDDNLFNDVVNNINLKKVHNLKLFGL